VYTKKASTGLEYEIERLSADVTKTLITLIGRIERKH